MSPEVQVVRREVGLGSVILQNHRKKVLKATEERLMEFAGNFMGVDVIQNLFTGVSSQVSTQISLQFYTKRRVGVMSSKKVRVRK